MQLRVPNDRDLSPIHRCAARTAVPSQCNAGGGWYMYSSVYSPSLLAKMLFHYTLLTVEKRLTGNLL